MILYQDKYDKLNSIIQKNGSDFSACLMKGDYGKGKSTLINQVLASPSNPRLAICQYPGMNTPYEALFSALQQRIEEEAYPFQAINVEISHREYLKQLCIYICKQTPGIILIFQDMKDYDRAMTELILEILQFLEFHHVSCTIIMEYSTDNLSFEQREQLMECEELCKENIILLDCKDDREYTDYFSNLLSGENKISREQMKNIIKEAFFNPALIKKMVYYFVDVGIFYQCNDAWHCDEIDFHLTAKLFEKHIYQRYSRLDEVLKRTIDKACITGFEINPKLLYQPLGILKSEENLRRIERLSRLIVHTEHSYEFENNTVYNLINDKLKWSEKKAQHLLVAEYLYKKIDDCEKANSLLHLLNIIKSHYLSAEKIDEALHVIGCYIQQAYEMRNYDAALAGIREFQELSNGKFPYAEQQLVIKEMEICRFLGKFPTAYQRLDLIKKKYLPLANKNWLEYWKAYCLFNSGQTEEAKEKADMLIEKLDEKQLRDEYLTLKLDILLAGMYHHFGDIPYASKRYEQGLAISCQKDAYQKEYHYLLSISNMFLDNELAIGQIEKSMCYFEDNHLMVSYAKSANNVAINYIYLGEYDKAASYLEKSEKIFSDMCSISYHYPLNNLGTAYVCLKDYDKALECFIKARDNPVEPFSYLWISMNIANCSRKQGDREECRKLLDMTEKEIQRLDCNTYLLERNFHISKTLLYLEEEDFVSAYTHCERALELEVNLLQNDTYPVYYSKLLAFLAEKLQKPLPQLALPYKDSSIGAFYKNLLENHIYFGNLLFWEA